MLMLNQDVAKSLLVDCVLLHTTSECAPQPVQTAPELHASNPR
jgi:hypothetical protein